MLESIHSSFERVAGQFADRLAVHSEHEQVSYRELNDRSNALAHTLLRFGLTAEDLVGIYLPRSVATIVAILAVLKAGGAYVPLDMRLPEGRVRALVDLSRPKMVLSGGEVLDSAIRHVSLSSGGHALHASHDCAENPDLVIAADRLAAVLFTSGTSGTPKGVLLEHGGMLNHVRWVATTLYRGQHLWTPHIAAPTFDASIKQIFTPLLSGGGVWLAPPGVEADPKRLVELMCGRQPVHLNCIPDTWKGVVNEIERGARAPAGLKLVSLGGDYFSREFVSRARAIFPGLEIVNLYGPTEATGIATFWRVDNVNEIRIGAAITNVSLRIAGASRSMRPGDVGELCIGGVGVARGYLNDPNLTAAKFSIDPEDPGSKQRLYRTGDIVFCLPDGDLQLVGRADTQVKINGIRIELAEVERSVAKTPGVRAAYVELAFLEHDEKTLIGYIAFEQDGDHRASMSQIRCSPPWCLVPSEIREVRAIPFNLHGKVDRRMLGASVLPPAGSFVGVQERQDPIEEVLLKTWRELTGVEVSTAATNFFDAGGSSLVLTKYAKLISAHFHLELEVTDLYRHTSFSLMASILRSRIGSSNNRAG